MGQLSGAVTIFLQFTDKFIMFGFFLSLVIFIYNNALKASEFHFEDMDQETKVEFMNSTLDEFENFDSPDKFLCLKKDRDWEKLDHELNFSALNGKCQGLAPRTIRRLIKEAYKGEDWIDKSAKLYQELKDNKDYHRYFNCKFIKRNILRDKKDCTPSAKDVFNQSLSSIKQCKKITGKMGYVGVVYLPYNYSICPNTDGTHDLVIKVHIKKEIKTNKNNDLRLKNAWGHNMIIPLEDKLIEASNIWNDQNPLKHKLKFKFQLVDLPENADFQIDLTHAASRGPYCKQWSTTWNSNDIAHEIGHMLGLDDEYNQVVGSALPMYHFTYNESYCNPDSIMCDQGIPKPYHYYMIFRRLLCQ
jgi:hypothetical protein